MVGKTSISLTERHDNSYKFQPQVAWEEDSIGDTHIKADAIYWDGPTGASPVHTPVDLTAVHGNIYTDDHQGPQVISSQTGDYMIVGWDYSETNSNCISNFIEPITAPVTYNKNISAQAVSPSSSYYLGVGRPGQHGGSSYPLDTLFALSMAGKQSTDMLYFYFDADSSQLYSKAIAPSATQLRLQGLAEKGMQNQELIVSPNPINEYLIVTLPEEHTNYFLQLFDITGKQMINITGNTADLQSALRKSIHQLSSGVYLLKVNWGSFSITQLINKL